MPLYLDEIWLPREPADAFRQALAMFGALGRGEASFPEGVTLTAGPWFSNEEAKLVLVLDIADHTKTFPAFAVAMARGLLVRRRLTPIVDWKHVEAIVGAL